jgi:hypothetical protein
MRLVARGGGDGGNCAVDGRELSSAIETVRDVETRTGREHDGK